MVLSMVFLARATPTEMDTAVLPALKAREPPPASAVMSDVSLALTVVNPELATVVLPLI